MGTIHGFKGAALAASIAMALVSMSAMATDPGPRQLPGRGTIVSGHVDGGVAGYGTQTITIGNASDTGPANAVINWGTGTDINPTRGGGFNVGANATVTFVDGTGNGSGAAVLNIDSTGNPSQIFGRLTGVGTAIFVANENGIVIGPHAVVSSPAGIGLIANHTLAGTGSDFDGSAASIAYDGHGGDVTVWRGASIKGASVLVAGGGNVNVDLSAFTGATGSSTLSAGMASANAGAGASSNTGASLTTAGALASGVTLAGFNSAGSALNNGTLALDSLDSYSVGGLFTNTGKLTLPASNGAVWNQGQLSTNSGATYTSLVNDGSYSGRTVDVVGGGDLVNHGDLTSVLVNVTDGNITNSGHIIGVYGLTTSSDKYAPAGAQYSIYNTGTVTSWGQLTIDANRTTRGGTNNTSGGSLYTTGTLQLAKGAKLQMKGWNDVTLGGLVQTGSGSSAADLSPTNPIGELVMSAGGYNATDDTPTFWTNGVLSVLTPVSVSGAILHGRQVKLMSSVSSISGAYPGVPGGNVTIVAGSAMDNDYAITVGDGAVISANLVSVKSPTYTVQPTDGRVVQPNVLLNGTLTANQIYLGDSGQPLSDIFSGPNGRLVSRGNTPSITIAYSGSVGTAPYLASSNFRYNYLPITANKGVTLALKSVAYATHAGTVNLLVDGNVTVARPLYTKSPALYGSGSASSPTTIPNTHLILQSTGNITTGGGGGFYWPGYVYFGNIGRNTDGSAAPGTLGNGSITLGGNLSNVLRGSTASDGGIEFITQKPLNMGSYTVTTNANSWISFGTDALTQQYASGALGAGLFYGGTQGSGTTVNYGPLDPSMFHTDTPVATR